MSYRLEFEPVANFLEEVFRNGVYDHKTAKLTNGLDAIDAKAIMALYGHFPQVIATLKLANDFATFREVVTMVGAGGREAQFVMSVAQDETWWKNALMACTAAAGLLPLTP